MARDIHCCPKLCILFINLLFFAQQDSLYCEEYSGADKSLARPEWKEANISVRMA